MKFSGQMNISTKTYVEFFHSIFHLLSHFPSTIPNSQINNDILSYLYNTIIYLKKNVL